MEDRKNLQLYIMCYHFLFKGHKLNSLMANMKTSYRIHVHNSDNFDNLDINYNTFTYII